MREIIKVVCYARKFWVRNPKKIKFWKAICLKGLTWQGSPVYISSTKKVNN